MRSLQAHFDARIQRERLERHKTENTRGATIEPKALVACPRTVPAQNPYFLASQSR
jgi:hypothetical protein